MKRLRKTNFRRDGVWILCADYLKFIREGGQMTPTEWNQKIKKGFLSFSFSK